MTGYPFDKTFEFPGVPASAVVLTLDVPAPRLTIAKLVVVQATGVKSGFSAAFYNSRFVAGGGSIDLDADGNGPLDPAVYQVGPPLVAGNGVSAASIFNVAYPVENQDVHQKGMRDRKLYLVLTPNAAGDFHVSVGGFLASTA